MRNRYPGICYRCHGRVEAGRGHFERHDGKWWTQHAECAIKAHKAKPPPVRAVVSDELIDLASEAFCSSRWEHMNAKGKGYIRVCMRAALEAVLLKGGAL